MRAHNPAVNGEAHSIRALGSQILALLSISDDKKAAEDLQCMCRTDSSMGSSVILPNS